MVIRWSDMKDRIATRKREPVAFVLSGGGPFGAVQVGVLKALIDSGITPDLTVGTSVGALNAVYVASNPTPEGAAALSDIWHSMRRDDLFPGGRLVSMLHALRKGTCVYSNEGLGRIIDFGLAAKSFEDLDIPAHVVATDLSTGEEAWFDSGPIKPALLASAAMPGVFPPVEIDGVTYIDGGVANNVPVSRAIEAGARKVYVINVNAAGQGRVLNRPHDFMMHGFVLARAQRYRREMETYRLEAKIIEVPMVEVGHISFTDLSHTPRLIDAGYEATMRFLAEPEPERDKPSRRRSRVG